MGTGGQAALNGCVNTRDGNQVAAMSGPTLDRVFDMGWLCAWSQNCVVVSFSNSQLVLYMFYDMIYSNKTIFCCSETIRTTCESFGVQIINGLVWHRREHVPYFETMRNKQYF